ncbi:MAG: asparagine synthase (glutamine-hydrolyzing) [bacterium]
MCGFAGFCSLSENQNIPNNPEQLLTAMQQSINHRGPDDHGIWFSQRHQVGLAHSRLAIIDLSQAAKQPMMDKEQTTLISFNGEIYNYLSIKKELENLGYQFFSQSDTEVLLNSYKEWGFQCLTKLDGMFAGVIFDIKKNSLFLFRDRVGKKPAYFSVQNGIFSFASEIKALWQLPWNKKNISQQGLYHYLTFMVTPAPYTIFEHVYKLPAGFYAYLDAQRTITFHEWYSPLTQISESEQKQFFCEDFCLENITLLLEQAAQKRLMSDVPFGAFLSGGIDSSLNVALMAKFVGKVKTFTVAFSDDPENNELSWARLVAQHFDTDHHEIIISEKEAFNFYEKMVHHLDEPLADCVCIPFYFVAQLAKDNGVTVVQVGEGADELFFGYNTYAKQKKFYDTFWFPTQKVLPTFVKKGIGLLAQTCMRKKLTVVELLNNWSHNKAFFWGGAIAFNEQQKKRILTEQFFSEIHHDPFVQKIYNGLSQKYDSHSIVDYHLSRLKQFNNHTDFSTQMLYLELKQRLPELLLMRADKMAMAASVEARAPFLDYKLVEFMLHVPASLKFKNNTTKYLLKKVAHGILPDAIINRKKIGFAAPTSHWFWSGNLFQNYFEQKSYFSPRCFTPASKHVDRIFNEAQASLAVKNWTLQNIWALK